jgi:type IV secretory pathway TrbD component
MTVSAAPESHPIHASLVRPVLFAGAEPTAAMIEAVTAGMLLFGVGFHPATIALAAFYLTVVHGAMVWVAKQDPQMSQLYLRSLTGSNFYAPHAALWAPVVAVRPAIPIVTRPS